MFFYFGYWFVGFVVEYKDYVLFVGLYQYWGGVVFVVRQIVQQWLRWQVKVLQIVVCGLEVLVYLVGGGIYGYDRGVVFIVQCGMFVVKEIWCGVVGGQIDQIQFCVIGYC